MNHLGRAFEDLLGVLDKLEIKFLVGGSVASATHAFPRFTQDIDLVVDLHVGNIESFCDAIRPSFYVDRDTAEHAILARRPFNIIHSQLAVKFDIFPASGDAFAQAELDRRRYLTSHLPGLEGIEFPVASPEDIILSKLAWFRRGGGTSERQWKDILDVIKVCAASLDHAYLEKWATSLHVSDLLKKAFGHRHG